MTDFVMHCIAFVIATLIAMFIFRMVEEWEDKKYGRMRDRWDTLMLELMQRKEGGE